MTSAEAGDSLDFDFFDSPRRSPAAAASRPKSAKPGGRQGNRRTPSPSHSSASSAASRSPRTPRRGNAGSSDVSDFLSDTEAGKDDHRGGRGSSNINNNTASSTAPHSRGRDRSESLSSLSSSGDSRSRSRSSSKGGKARRRRLSRSSSASSYSRSSSNDSRSNRSKNNSPNKSTGGSIGVQKSRSYNIENNKPMPKQRGPSPPSQKADANSSSAYSDDFEDDDRSATKPPPASRKSDSHQNNRSSDSYGGRPPSRHQAWGEDSSRNNNSININTNSQRTRPKTAKPPTRGGSAGRDHFRRDPTTRSDSDALSDSDMTDVSSMDSTRSYNARRKNQQKPHKSVTNAGDSGASRLKFRPMPGTHIHDLSDDGSESQAPPPPPPPTQGGLDLEILMKAVGELEKQKRLQANSRRVAFAPMTLKRNERKKDNYTFDKNQSREIDRENQRLLNEIVFRVRGDKRGGAGSYARTSPHHAHAMKLTASAVNRERDMRRIENENMAFLKRLQKVKPTKTISRDHQIQSFESTQLHGVPIGALHPMPRAKPRPASGRSTMDDTSSIGSRTRSVSSLHSVTSSVRSRPNSRPNSRPCSATKRVDHRPEWNDRW